MQEKIKGWMKPTLSECSPVQAAASGLAIRQILENEQWGENEDIRLSVIGRLDQLNGVIYYAHSINNPSKTQKQAFLEQRFKIANGINGNEMPRGLIQRYNKVATRDKRDFLTRAARLAKHAPSDFQTFKVRVAGVFSSERHGHPSFSTAMQHYVYPIGITLKAQNHPLFMPSYLLEKNPREGPQTLNELALCCAVTLLGLMRSDEAQGKHGNAVLFLDHSLDAVEHIYDVIDEIQSDIPEDKRDQYMAAQIQRIVEPVANTHHLDMQSLSGLLHYYLEHHGTKLSVRDRARLTQCHLGLVHGATLDRAIEGGISPGPMGKAYIAELEEEYARYHKDYPKPDIDSVITSLAEAVEQKYQGRPRLIRQKKEDLRAARESIPPEMEEIVLLHYPEPPEIRKIRKRLFSDHKRDFLKDLATNNRPDLIQLGLTQVQINQMQEDGKIPEGSNLTLEHIIDREHGGTNHTHNFILMPERVNRQKDRFKRLQTGCNSEIDQGAWIVSWVPKKLPDGSYPKIFLGRQGTRDLQPKDAVECTFH